MRSSCAALTAPTAGLTIGATCSEGTTGLFYQWTGSAWAVSGNTVSVAFYGAKGDGTTDDTTAIQNALNAIGSGGGTVIFPPTTTYYKIVNANSSGNALVPKAGTHVIGYGAKLQLDGSSTSGGAVLTIENDNVTLEGIEVTTSVSATKGYNGIGIARRVADNVVPKRARVINTYVHGFKVVSSGGGGCIVAETGVTGLEIANNFVDNCDDGIWISTSTTYPIQDGSIVGNTISNITNTPADLALAGNAIMVTHNTAVDAIHPDTDDMNLTIQGNTIRVAPVGVHIKGVGKVSVIGNTATGLTTYGLFLEESMDVDFSKNGFGGAVTNYVKILQISGTYGNQRNQIVGNLFRGSASGAGMSADGSATRSWVALNNMQAVSGARFSFTAPNSNVIVDANEAAAGGIQIIQGLQLGSPTGGDKGAGTLNAAAGLYDNGTRMLLVLTGTTGSIGGGALLAGACASGTVSVTDSTTSMVAVASPNTYPGDGIVWDAQVTANGTVTVKVCAILALTPTASTYNVRVIQ